MKTKSIFPLLSLLLLCCAAPAQQVIYMTGNPTAGLDHDKPNQIDWWRLKAGDSLDVRPHVPEWDAETDKVIYTIEVTSGGLTARPNPDRPGWWTLVADGTEKRVEFRYYTQAEQEIVYKIPVRKGTNEIAQADENGKYDPRKVTWSRSVLGTERILIDEIHLTVIE